MGSRGQLTLLLSAVISHGLLVTVKADNSCVTPTSCNNHGHCGVDHNGSHGFPCICDPGYIGTRCSSDVCASNPCLNNGQCSVYNELPFYTCNCTAGFMGETCSHIVPTTPGTCSAAGVVTAIAVHTVAQADTATPCPATQARESPEAFVMNHCNVNLHPSSWTLGQQIYSSGGHCSDVPLYTPVAMETNSQYFYTPSSTNSTTGVFLGCLDSGLGFKMAVQQCGFGPEVIHITSTSAALYRVLTV